MIASRGDSVLLITGGSSLKKSGKYQQLVSGLEERGIEFFQEGVTDEPSPELVDEIAEKYRGESPDLVIAIGGGSVMDAGKAVSAMLPQQESVMDYLEGVGRGKEHNGEKVPFIAVPTTSGTGSEATKNAVLSNVGEDGFKKSLRHDNFVPDVALLDPLLTVSCPENITAASGLDALSQLLGAYLSTEASPFTDSLIVKALSYFGKSFLPACQEKAADPEVRSGLAYGSLISGIVLANAGLGIVHGLASPIGGFHQIPHGVVCGALLEEAVRVNIEQLNKNREEKLAYLRKYALAGILLTEGFSKPLAEKEIDFYCDQLLKQIRDWKEEITLPGLGDYGIDRGDFAKIIEKASLKNNPVQLSEKQIEEILQKSL